jgi:hypothetical protein
MITMVKSLPAASRFSISLKPTVDTVIIVIYSASTNATSRRTMYPTVPRVMSSMMRIMR